MNDMNNYNNIEESTFASWEHWQREHAKRVMPSYVRKRWSCGAAYRCETRGEVGELGGYSPDALFHFVL